MRVENGDVAFAERQPGHFINLHTYTCLQQCCRGGLQQYDDIGYYLNLQNITYASVNLFCRIPYRTYSNNVRTLSIL